MQSIQNTITIADFLPKYPYINNPRETDEKDLIAYAHQPFEQTIYTKKEFYDNRLQKLEKKPTRRGELMKHQKIVSRYMSIVTPYDGILLFHAMGSGKACSAVGIGEQLRSHSNESANGVQQSNKTKGMIFLARGPNILNNIAKELIYVCTDGKYIPEDLERLKPEMRMAKIKRSLLPYYSFYTIDKFLKNIKNLTPSQVRSRFSNYAFCIDEVHNLRTKDASAKTTPMSKDYHRIHTFLHQIQNKKVILLSGTPMADLPSEIADIMNLILPLDQQMPTGANFDKEFLIQSESHSLIYSINPDTRDTLKHFFKGRVSYLKAIQAGVDVKYIGEPIGLLQFLNLYLDDMPIDSIQNHNYLEAYRKDSQKNIAPSISTQPTSKSIIDDRVSDSIDDAGAVGSSEAPGSILETGTTGLYHNSQQASIAVFPNGTYGSIGFKQYIKESKSSLLMKDTGQQHIDFTLIKKPVDKNGKSVVSIQQFLRQRDSESDNYSDQENSLHQLSKLSVKFARVITQLLERSSVDKRKGSSFVYCNWVTGSGCILFSKILELFGFKKASGGEKTKGLRYALLTSSVATDNQISSLIETFNQPENVYGDIINVIIGSKIISEGVTFKNVQDIHILSPHWNYTVTEQALSRAIRAFSHDILQEQLKSTRQKRFTVSVYLHATVPAVMTDQSPDHIEYDIDQSIDIGMYEKSEHKDISIKRIEYVMKQAAFDCALNYRRNYRGDYNKDGSRECDYGICDYGCQDLGTPVDLTPAQQDLSTYRLYYQQERIIYLIRVIKSLFRVEFIISLEQLMNRYGGEFSYFELLSALNNIIDSNIPLYNRYGFLSYIGSFNNFYFLINSLGTINNSTLSYYYTQYPPIHSSITFNDIVDSQSIINYPNVIAKLCSLPFTIVGHGTSDRTDSIRIGDASRTMQPINDTVRLAIFTKLPLDIQEVFLEAAHIFKYTGAQYPAHPAHPASSGGSAKPDHHKQLLNKWLLNLMRYYLLDVKISLSKQSPAKMTTISILLSANEQFRYFDKESVTWKDADTAIAKQCQSVINNMLARQEKSPSGWYGIANYDKFFLKDTTKKGAQNKGEDCSTIPVWKLYYIIMKINKERIKKNDVDAPVVTKKEMLSFLNPSDTKKQTQFQIMMSEPSTATIVAKMLKGDDYSRAISTIYWYAKRKVQKQRLCEDIAQLLSNDSYIIGYYLTAKQTKMTKPRNLKQRNK